MRETPDTPRHAVRSLVASVTAIIFLVAGVVGVAVRFFSLNYGYTFDEAFVALTTKLSWTELLRTVRLEGFHAPLYYLTAKAWAGAFGSSDVSLRILSALIGSVAVCAVMYLAYQWWGKKASVVAFCLAATSTVLVVMSREARMYSLLTLFVTADILVFWRWITRPTYLNSALCSVVSWLALMTHPIAVVLLAGEAVFLVLQRKRLSLPIKNVSTVVAVTIAAAVPWYAYSVGYLVIHPLSFPEWTSATNPLQVQGMFEVVRDFIVFHHGTHSFSSVLLSSVFIVARPFVAVVMFVGLLYGAASMFRKDTQGAPSKEMLLVCILVCSLVPCFLLSPMPKYFIPGAVVSLLLIARGLSRLAGYGNGVPFLLSAVIICGYSMTELPALVRGEGLPWRYAAQYIAVHDQQNDLVLVHQWPEELTVRRYYKGPAEIRGVLPIDVPAQYSYGMVLARYNRAQVISDSNIGPWLAHTCSGHSRVWYVYGNDDPFFRGSFVIDWLRGHGWNPVEQQQADQRYKNTVLLFERKTQEPL